MEGELVRTGFLTRSFKNVNGDSGIWIMVLLEENGRFIKIAAPGLYVYREGPHKAALFQTLLSACYETKMVQCEYDAADGEVRATLEFPLEDAKLTQQQLIRCVNAVAAVVDHFHMTIVAAMTTGELPKPRGDGDMVRLWQEFQEFLEKKRREESAKPGEGLPS